MRRRFAVLVAILATLACGLAFGGGAEATTTKALDTGFMTSSSQSQVNDNGIATAWANVGWVSTSDDQRATVTIPANSLAQSIWVTGFGFTIPSDATITGVAVEAEGFGTDADVSYTMRILSEGAEIGFANAPTTPWPTGTDAVVIADYPVYNWGLEPTTFTPAVVNDASFGTRLTMRNRDLSSAHTFSVNAIRMKIYYTVLSEAPSNDAFADAEQLVGNTGTIADADNTGATTEIGEPAGSAAIGAYRSIWYKWTAPAGGGLTVDIPSGALDLDTVMTVWSGNALGSLVEVASNNDGHAGADYLSKLTNVPVTSGTTYYIQVGGYGDTPDGVYYGPFTLAWEFTGPPANDDFADAESLAYAASETSGGTSGSTWFATIEPSEPTPTALSSWSWELQNSVWYEWTAAADGSLYVDLPSSDPNTLDTAMAVYTGSSLGALVERASNDDAPSHVSDRRSEVTCDVEAGTTYYIQVGGLKSFLNEATFSLIWEFTAAPANNDFADAQALIGDSGTGSGSNAGATLQANEQIPNGWGPGELLNTVWYSWTAAKDGLFTLDFTTTDLNFYPVVTAWKGTTLGSLVEVASDANGEVRLDVASGITYYLQLAGDAYSNPGGPFDLSWGFQERPANDDFGDAQTISGASGSVDGDNTAATAEAGETALYEYGNDEPLNTVWYGWTAPAHGDATWEVTAGTLDTVVGVYTGTSVDALTLVAWADDGSAGGQGWSKLTAQVRSGTTYYIRVDGSGDRKGDFTLQWSLVAAAANDDFIDAGGLLGSTGSTSGNNTAATIEPSEAMPDDLPLVRTVWYEWTAAGAGSLHLNMTSGDAALGATFMAVYTGGSLGALTQMTWNDGGNDGKNGLSELTMDVVAGTTYRVQIGTWQLYSFGAFTLAWEFTGSADEEDPTIDLTSPVDGSTINDATPTLTYSASDNSGAPTVEVTVDGVKVSTVSGEDLAELADGSHTVTVTATDTAGNTGSDSATFTVDTKRPTVTDMTPLSPYSQSIFNMMVTFSEPVSGFAADDVSVINGTVTSVNPVGPPFQTAYSYYSVNVTAIDEGPVTPSILEGGAQDAAGNTNTAGVSGSTWLCDRTAPTDGQILINGGDLRTNDQDVTLTVSATDAGTGVYYMRFGTDGINWTGWYFYDNSLTSNTKEYTVLGEDGTKTVYVQFKDMVGNESAGFSDSILLDTVRPVPTVHSYEGRTAAYGTFPLQIAFSESVLGFTESDISVTNGAVVPGSMHVLSGGKHYDLEITPTGDGPVSVSLAADMVVDQAGNPNVASNVVEWPYDGVDPTVDLTSPVDGSTLSDPTPTLTYSATDNLEIRSVEVTVDGSPVGTLSGGDLAELADGSHTVMVTATDTAGNTASDSSTFLVDTTFPTDQSVWINGGYGYTKELGVTLSFYVDGADWMRFQNADRSWSEWEAYADGTKAWTLAEGDDGVRRVNAEFKDNAGNTVGAYDTITLDTVPPQAYVGSLSGSNVNAAPILASISFGEPVTGFVPTDITIGNGTVDGMSVPHPGAYYATITPTAEGQVTVSVAAGVCTDLAGNANLASTTLTVNYDITAPSVYASPLGGTFTASVDVTLISPGSSIYYTIDPVIDPATAGNPYTAPIHLTETTTLRFAAVDQAGNKSPVATETYTIDAIPDPTINSVTTGSTISNDASVDFTVTFSEAVDGVSLGNFDLASSGLTGASISGVNGSGATRTVTVSTGTGDGWLRLDLDTDLGAIASVLSGKTLKTGASSETVTIDKTDPQLTLTGPVDGGRVTVPDPVLEYSTSAPIAPLGDGANVDPLGTPAPYTIAVWEDGTPSQRRNGDHLGPFDEGSHTVRVDATDPAGNSASRTATFMVDLHDPTVTIDQAATQADPTSSSPITFTVVFSEPVTGFTASDVNISGTAAGTKTIQVSGSGPAYTVTVSGMTSSGTVTASIPAGAAEDAANNASAASTTTDDTVQYDPPTAATPPIITVPADITVEATSSDGARVSFSNAVKAGEPVDGHVHWSSSPASGSTFPLDKTTTVTVTARDAAGHTATRTFSISVVDTTAPRISIPSSRTFWAPGPSGRTITGSMLGARATDAVDGTVAITYDPALPKTLPLGSTVLTLTAADKRGNARTTTCTVIVAYNWSRWVEPNFSTRPVGTTLKVAFKLSNDPFRVTTAQALLTITGPDGTTKLVDAQPFTYWAAAGEYRYLVRKGTTTVYGISTTGWAKGTYRISADLGDGVTHTKKITLR